MIHFLILPFFHSSILPSFHFSIPSVTLASESIASLRARLTRREISPADILKDLEAAIEKKNPAFHAYLMQTPEFSNMQYVDVKVFASKTKRMMRWMDVNWMIHPNLTGVGTSTEKCYLYHRNAIGHAANSKEMDVEVDYDKKQAISWSRATLYHGSKLLQNTGVVQMRHDGSAYVAS